MKTYLIAALMIAALPGAVMAKNTHSTKHATSSLTRAEKARRQIAHDLHWRGSNIPPAFSATGQWSR